MVRAHARYMDLQVLVMHKDFTGVCSSVKIYRRVQQRKDLQACAAA